MAFSQRVVPLGGQHPSPAQFVPDVCTSMWHAISEGRNSHHAGVNLGLNTTGTDLLRHRMEPVASWFSSHLHENFKMVLATGHVPRSGGKPKCR